MPSIRSRKLLGAAVIAALSPALTLSMSPASSAGPITNCSSMSDITSCVMGILAPAGGTHGVYLQQTNGPVLASANASFAYEPASSIKPLIALYALTQVADGNVLLSQQIPMISGAGGADDCPPATFSGYEPLGTALQQMLQVSDNNRTDELMRYFGVTNLNNFAASLGLTGTKFQTSTAAPGFNVIGCLAYGNYPLPATFDGNTMTLADAARMWTDIASLPGPYAAEFYELAAGRDMFNSQGYDFTGIWPAMVTIAQQEAPAGMPAAEVQSFIDHMTMAAKGGSYHAVNEPECTESCEQANWFAFTGNAVIPSCTGHLVKETHYNWGYFINDAVEADTSTSVAGQAIDNANAQLLAAPIAQGLASWASCAPHIPATIAFVPVGPIAHIPAVGLDQILGIMRDRDRTDIAADLYGTINWGDGSPVSDVTIWGGHGFFLMFGWHQYYGPPATYQVTITVNDVASGQQATVTQDLNDSLSTMAAADQRRTSPRGAASW